MARPPVASSQKALLLELKGLQEEPVEGFRVTLVDEGDLYNWEVAIFGPPNTYYEGGYFKARLKFPIDYPYSPPAFRFLTKMWHPNIYETGDVCISILHPPVDDPQSGELPSERWNPTQNVRTILLSVISLLNEPNTFSPANVDASVMYRKWKESQGRDQEYTDIIRATRTHSLQVALGAHRLSSPAFTLRVQKAVPHPDYRPPPLLEHDLALLKLETKVKTSRTVRPLPLPWRWHKLAPGTPCSLAGWGQTEPGGPLAQALQELDMRMLDLRMCNNSRFWNGGLTANMLCLGEASGQSPCKGDSGGPVVCARELLAGVLSFSSRTCTDTFKPPVATAVGPYLSWIWKTVARHALARP